MNNFLFFFFFFSFLRLSRPDWGAGAQSPLTATSASQVQAILLPQLQIAGTTGACHHARLIFVFLVEPGFCHIGQAGLELLTSSDPPVLTSRSAEITGVCHHTWPVNYFNRNVLDVWARSVSPMGLKWKGS